MSGYAVYLANDSIIGYSELVYHLICFFAFSACGTLLPFSGTHQAFAWWVFRFDSLGGKLMRPEKKVVLSSLNRAGLWDKVRL